MRIIFSTLDNSKSLDTSALLDCGCTSSTIHTRFVKKHNLPTKELPQPIPVYNADGTLNHNGVIKETTTLRMIIQDHVKEIMFAISDVGNTDVYIGHEWLKKHNPDIDWEKSRIFMNQCKPSCQFIDHFNFIDRNSS